MPKITKRTVDAAEKRDRRYIVWDTEIKGFGLLVLPTGVKSFLYNYRTPEGRERRITIGQLSDALPPDMARARALQFARHVAAGNDPLGEKQERRNARTVADLLDLYLESQPFKDKAVTTQVTDRGRIERHLRPLLGRRFVDKLRPEEVRKAHADIRDGKTAGIFKVEGKARALARVTGGEATARDTIILLRTVLNWAMGEGLATANPAAGLKLGATRKREAILAEADDYARLFKTLDRMKAEKRLRAPAADAMKVLALTGARKSEIAALQWSHVDLKAGRIVLPPTRHKAGKATGKNRIIELPSAAQAVIAAQPAGEPDDYVFRPHRGEGGCIALSKPWREVRKEAKLPEGIGLHGLRHSHGSHLAMAGASAVELMQALGHAQVSTTQRYVHFADQARSRLAERAAAVALAGMAQAEGKERGTVKPRPKLSCKSLSIPSQEVNANRRRP